MRIFRSKAASLNRQIKAAELQALTGKQHVDDAATRFMDVLHRQITAPVSLWLAGGTGFVIGEVTQQATFHSQDDSEKTQPHPSKSALSILFQIMTSAHSLCTLLPLTWMIRLFKSGNDLPSR